MQRPQAEPARTSSLPCAHLPSPARTLAGGRGARHLSLSLCLSLSLSLSVCLSVSLFLTHSLYLSHSISLSLCLSLSLTHSSTHAPESAIQRARAHTQTNTHTHTHLWSRAFGSAPMLSTSCTARPVVPCIASTLAQHPSPPSILHRHLSALPLAPTAPPRRDITPPPPASPRTAAIPQHRAPHHAPAPRGRQLAAAGS